MQEKLEELKRGSEQVKEHSPASAQALKSKETAHEERARMAERYDAEIQAFVMAGRYREAADKQTEKEEKLKNIGAAAVGTATGHGVPLHAVSAPIRTMAELADESSAVPRVVSLKGVVMLSLGIASSVPEKGKGKTQSKPNKGKGKDGGKDAQREKCKAMYVGQEGRVLCIVAFGSNVDTGGS